MDFEDLPYHLESMKQIIKTLIAAGMLTLPLGVSPALAANTPVVIELFTSQGCSSCPPADKVLARFAGREDVIALSLPVDYWDYLGWKDTLALKGHTERQYAYAKSHGDSMVYTPQMVINGALALTGNNEADVGKAIAHVQAKAPLTGEASLKLEDEKLLVRLDSVPEGQHTVWLVPLRASVNVEIGRGENAGRTITYVNVPLTWIRLGTVGEGAKSFSVDRASLADADGCAVLVQSRAKAGTGPLVAAASLRF